MTTGALIFARNATCSKGISVHHDITTNTDVSHLLGLQGSQVSNGN
jgi:hypothetical protein